MLWQKLTRRKFDCKVCNFAKASLLFPVVISREELTDNDEDDVDDNNDDSDGDGDDDPI